MPELPGPPHERRRPSVGRRRRALHMGSTHPGRSAVVILRCPAVPKSASSWIEAARRPGSRSSREARLSSSPRSLGPLPVPPGHAGRPPGRLRPAQPASSPAAALNPPPPLRRRPPPDARRAGAMAQTLPPELLRLIFAAATPPRPRPDHMDDEPSPTTVLSFEERARAEVGAATVAAACACLCPPCTPVTHPRPSWLGPALLPCPSAASTGAPRWPPSQASFHLSPSARPFLARTGCPALPRPLPPRHPWPRQRRARAHWLRAPPPSRAWRRRCGLQGKAGGCFAWPAHAGRSPPAPHMQASPSLSSAPPVCRSCTSCPRSCALPTWLHWMPCWRAL